MYMYCRYSKLLAVVRTDLSAHIEVLLYLILFFLPGDVEEEERMNGDIFLEPFFSLPFSRRGVIYRKVFLFSSPPPKLC